MGMCLWAMWDLFVDEVGFVCVSNDVVGEEWGFVEGECVRCSGVRCADLVVGDVGFVGG